MIYHHHHQYHKDESLNLLNCRYQLAFSRVCLILLTQPLSSIKQAGTVVTCIFSEYFLCACEISATFLLMVSDKKTSILEHFPNYKCEQ